MGWVSQPAMMLPDDFSEIAGMEYRRIKATGQFDHAGEVLLGPRTLLRDAFDGNVGLGGRAPGASCHSAALDNRTITHVPGR